MITEDLEELNNYLISKYIFCDKIWLEDKLRRIINTGELVNMNKIIEEITKIIKTTNINDFVDKSRILRNFGFNKIESNLKYKLNEPIFCQVISCKNIAEPNNQVNEIKKDDENNINNVLDKIELELICSDESIEKKKRKKKYIFKFKLTDGVNVIDAFEYERIKKFGNDMNTKYLILPTIEIVNGLLILTKSNFIPYE